MPKIYVVLTQFTGRGNRHGAVHAVIARIPVVDMPNAIDLRARFDRTLGIEAHITYRLTDITGKSCYIAADTTDWKLIDTDLAS